jgi:hypothetical protein
MPNKGVWSVLRGLLESEARKPAVLRHRRDVPIHDIAGEEVLQMGGFKTRVDIDKSRDVLTS